MKADSSQAENALTKKKKNFFFEKKKQKYLLLAQNRRIKWTNQAGPLNR
jgi:hypothetical protein